jgi:hypothetical protein
LPDPEGPSSVTNSPASMSSETSLSAYVDAAYRRVTFETLTVVPMVILP